jgi:hypothetical protein
VKSSLAGTDLRRRGALLLAACIIAGVAVIALLSLAAVMLRPAP